MVYLYYMLCVCVVYFSRFVTKKVRTYIASIYKTTKET